VACDQVAKLAHQLPSATERQIRLHPILDCGEMKLLKPSD